MDTHNIDGTTVQIGQGANYVHMNTRLTMNGKPRDIMVQVDKRKGGDKLTMWNITYVTSTRQLVVAQPRNENERVILQGIGDRAVALVERVLQNEMEVSAALQEAQKDADAYHVSQNSSDYIVKPTAATGWKCTTGICAACGAPAHKDYGYICGDCIHRARRYKAKQLGVTWCEECETTGWAGGESDGYTIHGYCICEHGSGLRRRHDEEGGHYGN